MAVSIKVEDLSKAYQLGTFSTGTLSRDIERWVAKVRGKEDPFLKIGEVNDRAVKGDSDIVWSLKDINFEIEEGKAVGIIGKNGAGKSTLLKILSQVTSPTTGIIKLKGRVASLLEVGTGFHPELTGRENIYLNGAILGMRKAEINRKFDEIVDFSGVERYIDTPVKRYSSGMYVRLAFAVAAHLESEILIVDEVLAVGDAEFQNKCLGKMGEVSKNSGRTILFVSHNIQAISSLCEQCILLKNGGVLKNGPTSDVINHYLNPETDSIDIADFRRSSVYGKELAIESIRLTNGNNQINYNEPVSIDILIRSKTNVRLEDIRVSLALYDLKENRVCTSYTNEPFIVEPGATMNLRMSLQQNKHLMPGTYKIMLSVIEGHLLNQYYNKDIIVGYPTFDIVAFDSSDGYGNIYRWKQRWGNIMFDNEFKILQ